jgi:hypothetical protein
VLSIYVKQPLSSVFAVRHPVDCLFSSLFPRPSSFPSHTPLNFYSRFKLMLRPIIFTPFSLLLSASYIHQLYLLPPTYLTELTALPHTTLHRKSSLRLSVQPSKHLFPFLPSHSPLNSHSHSTISQRPIIFTPFTGQNLGFTKNTTYQTKPTKDYVRNYQLFLQNKPNVKYAQISVSSFITSKYVKLDTWLSGKNKPNQSQFQTQSFNFA